MNQLFRTLIVPGLALAASASCATNTAVTPALTPDQIRTCGSLVLPLCEAAYLAAADHEKMMPRAAGARPPVINIFWNQTAWEYDPANTSTCASNGNTCSTATCGSAGSNQGPCLDYFETAARWTTTSPQISGGTAVVMEWMSAASTNADAVVFDPYLLGGSSVLIRGRNIGHVATTGAIGTVTGRNLTPGTAALTNIVLPTAPAEGYVNATASYPQSAPFPQLVVDSTNPASWWVYKQVTGLTYSTAQPFVKMTFPGVVGTKPTLATPVSGDSVTVYDPYAAEIVEVKPHLVDWDTNQNAGVWIQDLRFLSTSAPAQISNAQNETILGDYVSLDEVASDRSLVHVTTGGEAVNVYANVMAPNLQGGSGPGLGGSGYSESTMALYGDIFFEGNNWNGSAANATLTVDGDTIFRDTRLLGGGQINDAFVDNAGIWQISGNWQMTTSAYYSSSLSALWAPSAGNYTLDVPSGRLSIITQTAVHHLVNATLTLCGKSVACNGDAANLATGCNISITPANIDAAFSSTTFGDNASIPGCGAIGKFGAGI